VVGKEAQSPAAPSAGFFILGFWLLGFQPLERKRSMTNATNAISDAQLAANHANAQLSHGPVTEAGKRRSSLNAIRHGLTGRIVVLPTEDLNQYKAFSKEIVESLNPQTPLESQLAQTVADQQWRLNRVRSVEEALFGLASLAETGDPEKDNAGIYGNAAHAFLEHSHLFVNLTLYEQRIHRLMEKALKQLKELQAERRAPSEAPAEDPVKRPKLVERQHSPREPRTNGFDDASAGFVCSSDRFEDSNVRVDDSNARFEDSNNGFVYSSAPLERASTHPDLPKPLPDIRNAPPA
jgi:hypothetical protein